MTNVLGMPLDAAYLTLQREGFELVLKEVRSKKGIPDGTSKRVIRQTVLDEERVLLTYALFRTEPNEANA
ncbi:MAG: hypothetical protein VB034_13240 [Eubacteriales bacterium]|nr:hypothetical protein [Eubacteriales bacterium]